MTFWQRISGFCCYKLSNVPPLPPQRMKGKILTPTLNLTQHPRASIKHKTIFIPCLECKVAAMFFVRSMSQTRGVKVIAAAPTRCWQMCYQVLQCTCLTKQTWSASTPTHLQRHPALTHLPWAPDWTATLVQVQVRFSLHQLHPDQYGCH